MQPVEPLEDTVTPGLGSPGSKGRVWQRWGGKALGRKRAGAELQSRSPLFSSVKRRGVNDVSKLLLLLMNNLFAAFCEERGLGLGLKAQFD